MSTDIYQSPRARMNVVRAFLRCDRCEEMRASVQFCAVESGATVILNLCVRECFPVLVDAVNRNQEVPPRRG